MELKKLRAKITEANEAYRKGDALMDDNSYDALLDELSLLTKGKDPLLKKIGFNVEDSDERKEPLPLPMYSMNKVKTVEEIQKWARLKLIPEDTLVVITPKYDGLSLCVLESKQQAWTRGNGISGQRSDHHFKKILSSKKKKKVKLPGYSFGELIMKQSTFQKKWSTQFKNSRNMGAGAMNAKEIRDMLQDFDYLRFGYQEAGQDELDKVEQMKLLNKEANEKPVEYTTAPVADVSQEYLENLFAKFGPDYETDGLIIEINDSKLRRHLGREKNGNPVYARAWKGFVEQKRTTTINELDYQISKHGLLKPVARVKAVELDGVTVSNVTAINAKFVKDNDLGAGSEVEIIRSGQVIPKIVRVVSSTGAKLPMKCPSCSTKTEWNETEVELVCPNSKLCPEQRINKIIAFFEILEVDFLAQGNIRVLYENGYDTVHKILKMKVEDFEALEGFARKKAENIYKGIHSVLKDVALEKIRHASSVFEGLGSKKLKLLNAFDDPKQKPKLEEVTEVDGFSEKSAAVFIAAYDDFWKFVKGLPVTISNKKQSSSGVLSGSWQVCFSGVRRKDLEKMIEDNGGKVISSVSQKTTHLVMKEKGSGSAKEKKAVSLGIAILTEKEFESSLESALKG